jgi:pyruvate dehydrogenase E2 component (dihydrolipoamide acetyltransferase)
MERVFAMPDLGEGLEDGRIVEWLVAEGAEVALNQPLVEVETAKAAVEIPSPFAGRIVTLHGAVDADVPVGAPLITFDVEGDGAPALRSVPAATAGPRATPPVRKLAKELGIDLAGIAATGPDGRITEDDVRRAPTGTDATSSLDRSRRQLAAALTRQAAIPQVTTFRTVDCTALEAFRAEIGVSPLPIFIAALVRTVAEHPILNAAWTDDSTSPREGVHVAIAVDTEPGLVAPVIHDAPSRTVFELRDEIERLAASARDGRLQPVDLAGATIAVSNTGSYGSEAGTPILSPGTSVTLALGVIQPRALVVDGQVVARPAATISMTFDHRVSDGAVAGRALSDLVALLESAELLGGLPR